MRPGFLLSLLLVLFPAPSGLAGQASDTSATPQTGEALEGEAEITAVVRRALEAPDAPESWAGLAQALSAMGHRNPQGQLPQGILAAVRIADSLAFSPLQTVGGEPVEAAPGQGPGLLASLPESLGTYLPAGLAGILLLALVATGWLPGRRAPARAAGWVGIRRRGPSQRWSSRGSQSSPEGTRNKRDVRSMALSLVEHGIPANEVARRTGLAQDEVAVVLALHRERGGSPWDATTIQRSA